MELLAADEANIQAAIAYPPLVMRIIAPTDRAAFAEVHNAATKLTTSFVGKLMGRKPLPADEVRLPVRDDDCIYLNLENAWHAMHYLFTLTLDGGDPPLNFLLGEDQSVFLENTFGVFKVFSASQVRAIQAALGQLTDDDLGKRYSPEDMFESVTNDVATKELDRDLLEADEPTVTDAEQDDDKYSLEYAMKYVGLLRAFLQQAVEQKRGMIVYSVY